MADGDDEAVLALNEESVKALSPLDAADLAKHRASAEHAVVSEIDGHLVAFAFAFAPGAAYDSINYQWFAERFGDFLYLDRIAVGSAWRRRRLATKLYDFLEASATAHGRMVCEVNCDPPNEESLAFHDRRGYRMVGRLRQLDGHETVMLEKPL